MLTQDNQNDSNEKSDENHPPIRISETKSDTKDSIEQKKESKDYIKNGVQIWRESEIMVKTQIIMILCNIATIIAFIWVGSCQHMNTLDSIALADSSYILSKKSLDFAERNFQIENRPYIGIKNITLEKLVEGKKSNIILTYENYGKIPALEVRGISGAEFHTISTYVIPEESFYIDEKTNGSIITSVVPPFEPRYHIIKNEKFWDRNHIESLINNRLYLYVYGRFIYTDVFKGRDTTTFCNIYDASSNTFGSSISGNSIR